MPVDTFAQMFNEFDVQCSRIASESLEFRSWDLRKGGHGADNLKMDRMQLLSDMPEIGQHMMKLT